jgi:phosphoribosylglycinamide formyltransferase-1
MSDAERLRVVVLISGNGTNLQAIIDAQTKGKLDIEIVGVLSDRADAFGLKRAANAGIHTEIIDPKGFHTPEAFDAALAGTLEGLKPDLVVLAGYMRILADSIVNAYQSRMLNIHPSLLPAYPGLDTYKRALEAGESLHGTTVHFVIPQLDSGPPILQYRVQIGGSETEPELRKRVQQGEYIIYPQAIGWIADGRLTVHKGRIMLDGEELLKPVVIDQS